jgi:tungstate transport system substrate-binding protein
MVLLVARQAQAEPSVLRLGTTTTTDNSGLTSHLLPRFETDSGDQVLVITAGSGRVLQLLENGDIDIALTHAPTLEADLLARGRAVNHQPVMFNDFVLVGPPRDPAQVAASEDILSAMRAIARTERVFISRGDQSGTHLRELELWRAADIQPRGQWYREAGQGMGKTLQIAAELDAYTLVDRGSWLAYANKFNLSLLFHGSELLFNRYSVLSANPALYPDTNIAAAKRLSAWLNSDGAKRLIGEFTIDGHQLFMPLP